jgi:hypothetical protein
MIVLLVFFCFHSYMYLSPIEFKIVYKVSVTPCIQRFSLANICIECFNIREFQIQSIVGDHFSSPNMEIKNKSGLPHKDKLVRSEGALFEMRFLQIQAEKFSVYCYL